MAASMMLVGRRSARVLGNLTKTTTVFQRDLKAHKQHPLERLKEVANQYPDVEVSTEDFKHVLRLLPQDTVPEPPEHVEYPTPSGWVPVKGNQKLPYSVSRTRNHMFPIYMQVRDGGTRVFTKLRYIHGDIWALEAHLRKYLEKETKSKQVLTQVHEVSRTIRIKGQYMHKVSDFLKERGF